MVARAARRSGGACGTVDRLPYAAALAISPAATALVAAAFHRAISDVAIKRTAG